jgi:hypothetical protein
MLRALFRVQCGVRSAPIPPRTGVAAHSAIPVNSRAYRGPILEEVIGIQSIAERHGDFRLPRVARVLASAIMQTNERSCRPFCASPINASEALAAMLHGVRPACLLGKTCATGGRRFILGLSKREFRRPNCEGNRRSKLENYVAGLLFSNLGTPKGQTKSDSWLARAGRARGRRDPKTISTTALAA